MVRGVFEDQLSLSPCDQAGFTGYSIHKQSEILNQSQILSKSERNPGLILICLCFGLFAAGEILNKETLS